MKLRIPQSVVGGFLAMTLLMPAAMAHEVAEAGDREPSPRETVRVQVSANMKSRADQEITRRITALNALNARVKLMARVSAAEKAEVSSQVAAQISSLTALKAKIDADTDPAVLKADVASITASYRIFALVIPKGRILVAADKIATVSTRFTALGAKLQARITAAKTAGKDVSSLQRSIDDFNVKVADSAVQAQSAAVKVAALGPDNGDEAAFRANLTALKAARSDLSSAWKNLSAALKDAHSIIQSLRGMRISPSVTPMR